MHPARAARLMYQLPNTSRVFIKIEPRNRWGFQEAFLNKMVYYLETLVWQKSYNGKQKAQANANKPKLYVPDFMKTADLNEDIESHTVEEIQELLSKPRIA